VKQQEQREVSVSYVHIDNFEDVPAGPWYGHKYYWKHRPTGKTGSRLIAVFGDNANAEKLARLLIHWYNDDWKYALHPLCRCLEAAVRHRL